MSKAKQADGSAWDAAVVGGGIVGLSTALELQARGRRVVVVDPDEPRAQASFGNAGVISRGSILAVAAPSIWPNLASYGLGRDAAVRIRWASLPQFARWLPSFLFAANSAAWRRTAAALNPLTAAACEHHLRLAELAGATAMIRRDGYLKLYRDDAGFARSAAERDVLADAGVQAEPLSRRALRELEPGLSDVYARALFFPESGAVDSPGDLVAAYRRAFLARGGGWLTGRAQRLRPREGGFEVEMQGQRIAAAFVVVCAGVASGRLLGPLGYRFPLAAERGYHRQLDYAGERRLRRPMHDVSAGFAAAPMGGGVRVLTGIELAGPDDPPDLRQLSLALNRAAEALPVASAEPGEAWLGSRPSIADGRPVIGAAPGLPRLLLAFGHGHIGFSTGPVTGRIVADLLCGVSPPLPIMPFSPVRFA